MFRQGFAGPVSVRLRLAREAFRLRNGGGGGLLGFTRLLGGGAGLRRRWLFRLLVCGCPGGGERRRRFVRTRRGRQGRGGVLGLFPGGAFGDRGVDGCLKVVLEPAHAVEGLAEWKAHVLPYGGVLGQGCAQIVRGLEGCVEVGFHLAGDCPVGDGVLHVTQSVEKVLELGVVGVGLGPGARRVGRRPFGYGWAWRVPAALGGEFLPGEAGVLAQMLQAHGERLTGALGTG